MASTNAEMTEVYDAIDAFCRDQPELLGLGYLLATSDQAHLLALLRLRRSPAAFDTYLGKLLADKIAQVHENPFEEYQQKFKTVGPERQLHFAQRLKSRGLIAASVSLAPGISASTSAVEAELLSEAFKAVSTWDPAPTIKAASKLQAITKYAPYVKGAGYVLAAGLLAKELYVNISQWWRGEIDGVDCSRNIAASLASAGAGVGLGFMAGAVMGLLGALLGGLIGGIVASEAVHSSVDFFAGNSKERALKLAYSTLKLQPSATNKEVCNAYRELALKTHPDKGGDKEKFITINQAYELIRVARGF